MKSSTVVCAAIVVAFVGVCMTTGQSIGDRLLALLVVALLARLVWWEAGPDQAERARRRGPGDRAEGS